MVRKYQLLIGLFIFFIFISAGCIDTTNKNNDSIIVDAAGNGDFLEIQHAIDFVSNESEIFVRNGIYYENLVISKSIRLIGENKSTTIIDGGSKGTVVEITSQGWGNISDFTIQNSGDMGEPDFDAGIKVYSDDNIFHDLIISNNCYGVVLWYVNNILVNNSDLMLNGGCGLFQFLCDEIIVMNNRFSYNEYAVRLKGSTSGLIKNNILVDNNKGLQLCCGSRLNVIFRNSFINNSVYHASDESVDNVWYNYSMGNYWDNYGGVDTDLNGIGDSPYNISGTVSQQDRYPLMFPLFENYL